MSQQWWPSTGCQALTLMELREEISCGAKLGAISMKRIYFAIALSALAGIGPALSAPLTPSATDLWNGATASSTTLYPFTGAAGMFGGNSGGAEPANTVFGDTYAKGTLHTVDWQTAAPVTILSFTLFARHDGPFPTRDANYRGFDRFELFAFIDGSYQSIFSYDTPALRYGNNVAPLNSILETDATLEALSLGVNIVAVTSDKFRATFRQYGVANFHASGPRIHELDGFGSYIDEASIPGAVPVPAALPLFATGLGIMGFLNWRRKRKVQAAVAA